MMNFASYHKKVVVRRLPHVGGDIILENVQLVVSGNYLIANGLPTRDEELKEKSVTTEVIALNSVIGYDTVTTYYPEEGLENRQVIKG